MNMQNQRINDLANRRIGALDVRIVIVAEETALPRLWCEERGEAEPEDLSGKGRPSQTCDRVNAKQLPVRAAHAEFIAALSGLPPRPIPLEADALDLEDRADHLDKVFAALSVYVSLVLDDTAQNVPGSLDLRDVEGLLADLAADLTGAIQQAADGMAGRIV
jgi:hypothetical protein